MPLPHSVRPGRRSTHFYNLKLSHNLFPLECQLEDLAAAGQNLKIAAVFPPKISFTSRQPVSNLV